MIKYVVLPGDVQSKNDGQIHYIGAGQLMRLYNVDPRECVVHRFGDHWFPEYDKLIQLSPRYDGNYTLGT